MGIHIVDVAAEERAKYSEIWETIPDYRQNSPGLVNVDRFMEVVRPAPGASLIDIGCGAGVAGVAFQRRGFSVSWLDITPAGLIPEVDRDRFIECPLWSSRWSKIERWEYGFCCDVLEHIPTEYTMLVVDRILGACKVVWLQICFRPDEFGKAIGEPLHLTVRPYQWWLVRLATLGAVVDARDLCGEGVFVMQRS